MSAEVEFKNIEQAIAQYTEEARQVDEEEATLNMRMAAIRLEISRLRDKRLAVKKSIRQAEIDKESAARKLLLEQESLRLEKSLEDKRAEVADLIANAPWRDVAFDWQIEGAIRLPERALLADKRGLGKTL
jgi:hypothetical protein